MTDYSKLVEALNRLWQVQDDDLEDWVYGSQQAMCDAAAAIEDLQAQLPKLGEWVWDEKRCIYVCSVCGSPKVRENMDRQIIKEQAYCYSCGAKMEVQDG